MTQALLGEPVLVAEERHGWALVNIPGQPSSLDRRGYPGWLPLEQLVDDRREPSTKRHRVVRPVIDAQITTEGRPGRLLLSVATPLYSQRANGHREHDAPAAELETRTGLLVVAPTDAVLPEQELLRDGSALVETARRLLGIEYLWGGTSGFGLDCSGLIWLVLRAHGIEVPRDAHDQATVGADVAPQDLRAGDLVFFADRGGEGRVHHVGMALNRSSMLHAPRPGRRVEVASLEDPAYADRLTQGRRLR